MEAVYNNDGSLNHYSFSSSAEGFDYFVKNYAVELVDSLLSTGIYIPVAMTQKCWESSYGTSQLARNHNNFGGITYSPKFAGVTGIVQVGNYKFCSFSSAKYCFDAYKNIILSYDKNLNGKLLGAKDPQSQLKMIADSGYCDKPSPTDYYNMVSKLLNSCLKRYNTGKVK
jgi:flagellum-specific peptidoglycan hydrolase FlgJ